MTLFTGDPDTARGGVFPEDLDAQPTSMAFRARAIGASLEEGFAQTSEALIGAGIQRRLNAGGPILTRQDAEARATAAGVQVHGLGDNISEGALDVLISNQERSKRRQEIMDAADMPGFVRFAGNFVGSLPDPMNLVGLPFASGAKTVLGAVAKGVVANMATAAVVEPGYLMLNRYAGNDYDGWDSLQNIAFAGVIGGVSGGALKMFDHPRVDVEFRKLALGQVARDQEISLPAERNIYEEVLEGDRGEGFNINAYHGTNAEFKHFDLQYGGANTNARDAKGAIFFSDSPDVASGYARLAGKQEQGFTTDNIMFEDLPEHLKDNEQVAGRLVAQGANVRPVRLKMENPLEVDFKGENYSQTKFQIHILEAKKQGRDGVVFKNVNDDIFPPMNEISTNAGRRSTVYAAFDPDQVRGKFGGLDTGGPTARQIADRPEGGMFSGGEVKTELDNVNRLAPEADKPLAKVLPTETSPEVAELSKLANSDVQYAKQVEEASTARPAGEQEGEVPETALDRELAGIKEEETETNRFIKGIEAGLNCFLRKGVE